jgi:hypothetical protein
MRMPIWGIPETRAPQPEVRQPPVKDRHDLRDLLGWHAQVPQNVLASSVVQTMKPRQLSPPGPLSSPRTRKFAFQ